MVIGHILGGVLNKGFTSYSMHDEKQARSVVEALIDAGAINEVVAEDNPNTPVDEEAIARFQEHSAAMIFLNSTVGIDEQEDFTMHVPIILEVEDHWYQDISFEDCYEWEDDDSSVYYPVSGDEYKDIVYYKVKASGTITQINDATPVGEPGEWIKDLIDNNEYYKYDGVQRSDKPSKINFKDTAVDAIAMLEQIQGEDAQQIIRMFKELMASYDIYFEDTEGTKEKKELFSKVIRDYTGKLLTDGEDCVYKANIPPMQKGFDKDEIVQAPCNGKITYRTKDAVCIEIDAPDKTYDDYTILISGFKVNDDVFADTIVEEETELGLTLVQDLKLVLRDENGAIVKNDTIVLTSEEEEDEDENDDGLDTIDEQTAIMYGYTKDQLDTLYAIVCQEGIGGGVTEVKAVTTCMMFRAIQANMHTSDGEHYNAYLAAIAPNQFEAYGSGAYKKYLPGGSSYRYVNEQIKSAINGCLGVKSKSQLFHKYYFFLANWCYDSALNNCKPGTVPYHFTANGNWYYNNSVSYNY